MKIINLTPHTVNIIQDGKVTATYPSAGIARAEHTDKKIGSINNIPIYSTSFGVVTGLPKPSPYAFYIVSLATAQAAQRNGRTTGDLLLNLPQLLKMKLLCTLMSLKDLSLFKQLLALS